MKVEAVLCWRCLNAIRDAANARHIGPPGYTSWPALSSVQPVIFKLPSGCRSRV
jgi:hypothetical protein